MTEHLRALIVILVLATMFFVFARRYACPMAEVENFTRRRNLWFLLTLTAFLASNFWVYVLVAIPLLIYANRRESNPPAMFFFILFILPVATAPIPGMGVMNYLMDLSHLRLLELFILVPAYLHLRRQSGVAKFGRYAPDKALLGYLLLTALLNLRETTVTDTLRQAFYLFIDVFLPYHVISRSLKNMQAFREALLSLVFAIMVVAVIAVFEFYKSWLLYAPLMDVLELNGMGGYLGRDGMLRVIVTTGQAIALGYLMVVGMGLYLFLQSSIEHKFIRRLGVLLLAGGIFVPLSRGPWVGVAVLLLVYIISGHNSLRRLIGLMLVVAITLPIVNLLPGGERVVNLLPFVGSTEKANIDYREKLINNSMIVIQRNLWFGSVDYHKTPEMQEMIQGDGIIDIVNTYIGVTLETGLVGLGLFVSFFALILMGIVEALRSISGKSSEAYLLGQSLLSTQLAILVIIFTVSSITIIPVVYWSVAGLGVAYVQMIRNKSYITA